MDEPVGYGNNRELQQPTLVERFLGWFRTPERRDARQTSAEQDAECSYVQENRQEIDLLRMFPAAFTMVCCLVFMVPTWIILSVVNTKAISYFTSYWSFLVLVIPVIIIVTHCIHMRQRAPNKFAVIASLIIPTVVLLIFANRHYMQAVDKTDKLFSTDCDTFPAKRSLQRSWEVAYSLYMDCLKETSLKSNYSIPQLVDNFRITDCEEYDATGKYQTEWAYLAYLEENHFCSGWCYPSVQLWSSTIRKDSCAVVVSHLYNSYVRPHTSQVCIIMLATLGATAVILLAMGPQLRKHGIEW